MIGNCSIILVGSRKKLNKVGVEMIFDIIEKINRRVIYFFSSNKVIPVYEFQGRNLW